MKFAFGKGLKMLLGVVIAVVLHGCGDTANSTAGAQLTVSIPQVGSHRAARAVVAPDYIQSYTLTVLDSAGNIIVPLREISASGGDVSLTVPPNTDLQVIGEALDKDRKSRFSGNKAVSPIAAGTKANVSLTLEALSPLGNSVQAAGLGTLTVADNATNVTVITTNAKEDQHLVFSITGGADKDFFGIDASSGQLSFRDPPSSANPQDAGQDNLYEVQITFTDGFEFFTQDLKVVVGYLDTSFGAKGIVTTDIGLPLPGTDDKTKAVVVQTDDKIVVAGTTSSGSSVLVRYLANGSVDVDNFGTKGIVMLSIPNATVAIHAMALQRDGNIVVAGTSTSIGGMGDFLVARFDTTGQLDASFGDRGTPGMVITDVGSGIDAGGYDDANALAIQADGKIVVVGETSDGQGGMRRWIVARYDGSGTLDLKFGNGDGIADESIIGAATTAGASAVTLQGNSLEASGKIVVVGYGYFPITGMDFVVARYNSDGSLDTSFHSSGFVNTHFSSTSGEEATGVVIQPDGTPQGKIVATGGASFNGNLLARYNNDGTPDKGFGVDGQVMDYYGGAYAVVLQPDGKIVVAGDDDDCGECDPPRFALARYNLNGSVDMSFGNAGKIVTSITRNSSSVNAVALQPNGQIVAAGYASTNTGNDFALVRYNP